ncbi:hypothetical protein EI94DRAFT_1806841 [Lactarius quietus]|nr:hypothetical protein EI94DRAFT_1806841 [Lactarius quietus]
MALLEALPQTQTMTPASDSDQDDNKDNEDIPVGDSLDKAIALVKQIHKSPQAQAFFHTTCTQVNITPLELLLWIRTCWGSLFTFLERFIHLKLAVNQFILLADENESVPPLAKKRHYTDFHLSSNVTFLPNVVPTWNSLLTLIQEQANSS